jgi:cellulose synthase/poly-beta-1,6-N-acetylglucosamine synthase-like glycosyltransferase
MGDSDVAEKRLICSKAVAPIGSQISMGEKRPAVRTSVVVLTHNSAVTIQECLESLVSSLSPNDEVIVVDNASHDDTAVLVEQILTSHTPSRLIRNKSNLGFSAGCNVEVAAAVTATAGIHLTGCDGESTSPIDNPRLWFPRPGPSFTNPY